MGVGSRLSRRTAIVAGAVGVGLVLLAGSLVLFVLSGGDRLGSGGSPPPDLLPPGELTLIVAGDIACAPTAAPTATTCHQDATAAMLTRTGAAAAAGAVLLGDIQYESGRSQDFTSFTHSWGDALGAADTPIYPTPGNHEWYDPDPAPPGCRLADRDHNACGYETYFGDLAFRGDVADGRGNRGYRFRQPGGSSHPLILLLIDAGRCELDPSACSSTSAAASFLRSALADRSFNPPEACVVVGWHQARWSDYGHGDLDMIDGLWRTLFEVPAAQRPDLVVNGHDHLYERMPPLGIEGQPNDAGIEELIVGAGGREIAGVPYTGPAIGRAAYVDTRHFGVVVLSEGGGGITTTFLTEAGDQVDRVTRDCRT
jgi:hypothetical protein